MRASLIAALALSACASTADDDVIDESLVIAKLRMNDVVVVIESSDDGPRYTLTDHEGNVLARDLDLTALAARHPDAAEALETGVAGAFLDARLDRTVLDSRR